MVIPLVSASTSQANDLGTGFIDYATGFLAGASSILPWLPVVRVLQSNLLSMGSEQLLTQLGVVGHLQVPLPVMGRLTLGEEPPQPCSAEAGKGPLLALVSEDSMAWWSSANLQPAQTHSCPLAWNSSWMATTADLPEARNQSLCSPPRPSSLKVDRVPVRVWQLMSVLMHSVMQFSCRNIYD
jgi:hypothetical protein